MAVEKKVGDGVIRVVRGDITDMEIEAIVYDITEDAKLGTGYGGAITARGGPSVQQELDEIGACPKGEAIVTAAGEMKCRSIIHVNGPKFHEPDQEGKLTSAVKSALALAEENKLSQIAFSPIGTGFYQVDLNMCARVMVDTVADYLKGGAGIDEVIFVAFDTRELKPFEARLGQGG